MEMRRLEGKRVLITGACSGIGFALAQVLAQRGARILIASDNGARLKQVAEQLRREFSASVDWHVCDLSQQQAILKLASIAAERPLDLLINNAGLLFRGPLHEMTGEQADKLLAVNLQAPIHLTRLLLPELLKRPEAHIVNVASMCGYAPLPKLAIYQATKFGLVGFSESLRVDYGRLGIGVTTVCPGFVRTPLFQHADTPPNGETKVPPAWLSTTPERVAKRTVRAVEGNRRIVVVTPLAHSLYWVRRFCPGVFDWACHLGKRRATRKRLDRLENSAAGNVTRTR
jgi:short-subunit dehydrogenase